MMSNTEKNICRSIINEGNVKSIESFMCDGIAVKQYDVEYLGERYEITEHDGEIAYIIHIF